MVTVGFDLDVIFLLVSQSGQTLQSTAPSIHKME